MSLTTISSTARSALEAFFKGIPQIDHQHKILPIVALTFAIPSLTSAAEVNIYSARQPFLIQPILDDFTEQTQIETNIVYAQRGLVKRMIKEGNRSAADIVLTSDVAPLYQLSKLNLTQAIKNTTLEKNIPEKFRDPAGNWFGLTTRARIIYAAKDRVDSSQLKNYEDLMSPRWKGRICSRSAKHNYMLSLLSAILLARGEEFTLQWLIKVKENLARKPQGNDRAQVKAIKEGVCDVALVNTYYFGKMLTNKRKPEQISWANAVNLIFPNQNNRGSHLNISGIALARNAPNTEAAIQLMEYLSSDRAQFLYAQKNYEFPVRQGTKTSRFLEEYMPTFKQDHIPLIELAKQHRKVLALIEQSEFDQ